MHSSQSPIRQHFMVWMRTAALPQFRKLWGRIETDLKAGTYLIQVTNKYDTRSYNSKKSIILSTANAFGGQNMFLAVSYLVVGGICLFITILFIVKMFTRQS